jgi:hypothetical protein
MAPTKREVSNPRLFILSMVVDARLEELLIITILLPVLASFSTIIKKKKKLLSAFLQLKKKEIIHPLTLSNPLTEITTSSLIPDTNR